MGITSINRYGTLHTCNSNISVHNQNSKLQLHAVKNFFSRITIMLHNKAEHTGEGHRTVTMGGNTFEKMTENKN